MKIFIILFLTKKKEDLLWRFNEWYIQVRWSRYNNSKERQEEKKVDLQQETGESCLARKGMERFVVIDKAKEIRSKRVREATKKRGKDSKAIVR